MNFSPRDIGLLSSGAGATIADAHISNLPVCPNGFPALGDKRQINFVANAGNYDMTFHYAQAGDGGIAQISVDGNVLGSIDMYSPVATVNSVSFAGVTLVDGAHQIVFEITGKNGASADFLFYASWCSVIPH